MEGHQKFQISMTQTLVWNVIKIQISEISHTLSGKAAPVIDNRLKKLGPQMWDICPHDLWNLMGLPRVMRHPQWKILL